MLTDAYTATRRSIIAFASKAAITTDGSAPPFPTIIGTGFIVDERGIAVTNRHVVRALEKLPAHPTTGESAAFALACSEIVPERDGVAMDVIYIGLRRWDKLTTFSGTSDAEYFGEPRPDVAFVQLDVAGIPALSLESDEEKWAIGTSIGTAGYPLGQVALAIYGRVNQVAPILRHGVIASVYPFPCPRPPGFTIDIMTLGGESGSPIFTANDGRVLGLLHAGFDHTNITMAISSWLVKQALESYLASVPLDFDGVRTFDDARKGRATTAIDWKAV